MNTTEKHDLDDLLAFMYRKAEEFMRDDGRVMTMVHALARNGDTVLMIPGIEDSAGRGKLLQSAFVAWDIVVYGIITEAWALECAHGKMPEVRPSQSERRFEMLLACVSDGNTKKIRSGRIKRNRKGKFVGTTDSGIPAEAQAGGVLPNLLPAPEVSAFKRRRLREQLSKLGPDVLTVKVIPPAAKTVH